MMQTLEDPVCVQKFRKEPGQWDPIRLSGDTGDALVNRQCSDAGNQTLRHPHTLQYDIRSPRAGDTKFKFVQSLWQPDHSLLHQFSPRDGVTKFKFVRSAYQLDQSLSPQSGYGTSTSNSTGHHETQNSTSTVQKTSEPSFRNQICQPSKTLNREPRWSPKIIEGRALRRSRSLESDTRSRDPLHLINRSSIPSIAAQKFEYDIKVTDVHDKVKFAVAILDTGCHAGNWISRRLVEQLGRQDEISQDYEKPDLKDAGGHEVVARGIISLQWKWSLQGTRWRECKFFVLEPEYLDVLFGAEYIVSERLVTVNEWAMTPMIAHRKAPTSEKVAIALALEKQKQEKAALETQRIQPQQQPGQQQGGPSSQAQQSGQQGPTQTPGRQRPRGYGKP